MHKQWPRSSQCANEEQGHADIAAWRIALGFYNEIIRYLGDGDGTTRIAMEQIMATE